MLWSWSYRTCEPHDMDAGNHTQLLHKASVFLTTKPNLQPFSLTDTALNTVGSGWLPIGIVGGPKLYMHRDSAFLL